jgi:hypothetical protein
MSKGFVVVVVVVVFLRLEAEIRFYPHGFIHHLAPSTTHPLAIN